MNILTTENLTKYNTKNWSGGVGEWVNRNGVWAMDIRPAPFYQNYTDSSGNKISRVFTDEFMSASQWVFNLWIDGDAVISGGNNVACGMTIKYTDTTRYDLTVTGGDKGFQNKYYLTDSSKIVSHVEIYYYTSMPTYYRSDSFICPVGSDVQFNKNGIINAGHFYEAIEDENPARFYKGSVVSSEWFYEL